MNELITRGNALQSPINADLLSRFIRYTDREPSTTKGYLTCLRVFFKWTQENAPKQAPISRDDILAYKEYLNGSTFGRSGTEPLKAGTKQQYLRAVKHFFKWTAAEGFYPDIADNIHGAKVRHDNHKKDALTLEEAAAIERTIDRTTEQGKRLYAMFLLGARRGLRTVEISRLSVKDLHRKGDVYLLDIWGKGHSEPDATRALDPDTAAAITEYLQSRTDKYTGTSPLFVGTSNRSKGQRIAPTTISTMIKGALVAAGFDSERLTAHSLRHTAGTAAVQQGDIHAAQIFLRHDDIKNTQIYTHIDELERDAALSMKIYHAYHDTAGEAENRRQLVEMVSSLPAEKLQAALEYLKSLSNQNYRYTLN